MKKEYKKYLNLLKRISALLVFAFVLQIANNALFFHTHQTAGGKTFHHAHPNCGNHSHNDYQYNYYEQLQLLISSDTPDLLKETSFLLNKIQDVFITQIQLPDYSLHVLGRAPPIC